ncbi:bone morphogenetic protein 15 [Tachyglossus aculeatus]|uniref:bone morphogenetic protein 15 n=1 Tax=Tachyglossus aculeatus TaxID=9261 RepID=UPI0018F53713|nr:bone morphogenetic protein 15 [Tachyglossus aculeatus]
MALLCFFFLVLLPWELALRGARVNPQSLAAAFELPFLQEMTGKTPKSSFTGQSLQYMRDLYYRSASPEGLPWENRTLGATSVRLVPASAWTGISTRGPWYVQSLEYPMAMDWERQILVRTAVVYPSVLRRSGTQFLCQVKAETRENKPNAVERAFQVVSTQSYKPTAWQESDITAYIRQRLRKARGWFSFWLHWECRRQRARGSFRTRWRGKANSDTPFLLLYFNDTQQGYQEVGTPLHRRVRQAGDAPGSRMEPKFCSLHPLQVTIKSLGWTNWVIAPDRLYPNYCQGLCPRILRKGLNSPNHAIIQNLVNELVNQRVPRPCCVPYQYSPISILLKEDNGTILYKEWKDMNAQSCTCR